MCEWEAEAVAVLRGYYFCVSFIKYENCEMAIAISSSRSDSASVPGVAFKWLPQAYWAGTGI